MSFKRQDVKPCGACGEPLGHAGPIFHRVKVERLIFNVAAIREQAGLEMMLGSPLLASVMGPDRDLATELQTDEALVCQTCYLSHTLGELVDILNQHQEAEA